MRREIYKVRGNMVRDARLARWICYDENDNFVCDGGPSVIWDEGYWEYSVSGIGLHRLDGPAESGGRWFINGKNVTKDIHEFAYENSINLDNLTDEDKILIALKFG